MNRYIIGSLWDRNNRNGINKNFEYLFEGSQKIDELNNRAENILNEAKQTNAENNNTNERLDNLIAESGTSSTEVVDARGKHTVLSNHLDSMKRTANINLEDLWQPKNQPNIHSHFKGGDAFESHIYQEWLDFYEDLYSDFGGYITKATKPNIYEGRYEYPIYTFTPENGYSKTLILGSGMHGGEKMMVISLYKFLYHLCNDWEEDAHLSYIRNNIRLIVIPFENPFGIAYNTRKENDGTGLLTDINRNFDYNWNKNNDTNPDGASYKGTSPFTTKGATYIKEVLEEYSNAEAYIDFHNKSTVSTGGGFAVTSYVPSDLPFVNEYFEKLNDAITPKGKEYEISSFDEPSGFNYAANRFNMHSFNPEFTPGHMFTAYSSAEMTYALKWVGNIIIRFALLNNRPKIKETPGNPEEENFVRIQSQNRSTANAYNIVSSNGSIGRDNYGRITETHYDLYPLTNGYFKLTYSIVYMASEADSIVYFTPKVFQHGNTSGDFSSNTPISVFADKFEVYQKNKANDRNLVNIIAYIPVVPRSEKQHVSSELHAYVTSGTAGILKYKLYSEFIPTNNPRRVEYLVL